MGGRRLGTGENVKKIQGKPEQTDENNGFKNALEVKEKRQRGISGYFYQKKPHGQGDGTSCHSKRGGKPSNQTKVREKDSEKESGKSGE